MKKTKHLPEIMRVVLSSWTCPPKGSYGLPGVSALHFENVCFGDKELKELKDLYVANLLGFGLLPCRQGAKCFPSRL